MPTVPQIDFGGNPYIANYISPVSQGEGLINLLFNPWVIGGIVCWFIFLAPKDFKRGVMGL